MTKKKVEFYQIDYIDENEQANYIATYEANQLKKAIEHVNVLNNANACLNEDTYFVLDKYEEITEDEAEIVEYNITNAQSILDQKADILAGRK